VDPAKVAIMQKWPTPTNAAEMYKFIGFATFFRTFIRDFATIASPLYPLCKVSGTFGKFWTPLHQDCFDALKLALSHAPVLKMPDFQQPFEVIVDASNVAVGAVLVQEGQPVAYESKKLDTTQQKWTTTERELFAAVNALRVWRCYLQHPVKTFTLWTDHNPNTFFSTGAKPLSARQARWQEDIAQFNFVWKYKRGADNIADALSRLPEAAFNFIATTTVRVNLASTKPTRKRPPRPGKIPKAPKHGKTPSRSLGGEQSKPPPAKRRKQAKGVAPTSVHPNPPFDTIESPIFEPLNNRPADPPSHLSEFLQELWQSAPDQWFLDNAVENHWYLDSDCIWRSRDGRLILPPFEINNTRNLALEACHDSIYSGHFGKAKTLHLVQQLFFWPGMTKQVEQYCAFCDVCKRVKASTQAPQGELLPLKVPEGKWLHISMDMVTDLPETIFGNDSILVVVDRFTKMVHLIPCTKDITSEELVHLLNAHVFKLHGFPLTIVSDRGSIFTAKFSKAFAVSTGMKFHHSTAYHPQSDGQTERFNRIMEDVLRTHCLVEQSEWEIFLPFVEFAMNNSKHEAMQNTPFLLNYGINPRHPDVARLIEHKPPPEPTPLQAHYIGRTQHLRTATFKKTADLPEVTKFTEQMQKAIKHTKLYLEAARQRMMKSANKRRTTNVTFEVGDQVLLSTKNIQLKHKGCSKLSARFIGPFTIVEKINPVAFKVDLPATMKKIHPVFHVSLLRKYKSRDPSGRDGRPAEPPPPPVAVDGEEEYEVERIVDRRERKIRTKKNKHGGKHRSYVVEYLVRWKGYEKEHDEWLPLDHLQHCLDLVQEYHDLQDTIAASKRRIARANTALFFANFLLLRS